MHTLPKRSFVGSTQDQPAPVGPSQQGRPGDATEEQDRYARDLRLRDQRERYGIGWIVRTRTASRVSFHVYDLIAPERAFEAATNKLSYSVGGL